MLPAVEASSQPAAALTRRGINMTQCVARGVRRPVGERRQGSDSRSPGTPACRAPASRCHFPMPCCPPPAIFASLEACDSRQRDTSVAAPTCVGAPLLSARFCPAPQPTFREASCPSTRGESAHFWLHPASHRRWKVSFFRAWRRKAGPLSFAALRQSKGTASSDANRPSKGSSHLATLCAATCQAPAKRPLATCDVPASSES